MARSPGGAALLGLADGFFDWVSKSSARRAWPIAPMRIVTLPPSNVARAIQRPMPQPESLNQRIARVANVASTCVESF